MLAAIADPAPPISASAPASAVLPAAGTDAPAADFLALLTNALDAQVGAGATLPPTAQAVTPNLETALPSFVASVARTATGPNAPPSGEPAVSASASAPVAPALAMPDARDPALARPAPVGTIAPTPPQAPAAEPTAPTQAVKPAPDAKIVKVGTQRPVPADSSPQMPTTTPTEATCQPGTAVPIPLPAPPAGDQPALVPSSTDPAHVGSAVDTTKPRPERTIELTNMLADKIAAPAPDTLPQALQLAPQPGHTQISEPPTAHSTGAPSGAPSGAAPQGPAGQLGTAFVVLGREGDGTHHLSLELQPPDLGMVRITIEQGKDCPARVSLTAANPSTLLTLLRDQPALNDALDKAGIQGDGRVLIFHLAGQADPAPVTAAPVGQTIGDAPQSFGMSGQASPNQPGPGGRNGQDQPASRTGRPGFAEPSPREPFHPVPSAHRALTGIDITA